MERVLIFSSSSGGAHAAAADALAYAFRTEHGLPVEVVDLHAFLTPVERWFYRRGQFLFLNVTARASRALIRRAQRSAGLAGLARARYPIASSAVRAVLDRVQPGVIVSTHPLGAMSMGRFGASWRRPLFLLTINYEAHTFQIHPTVTTYCVPHEMVADDLRRLGVPPEKIAVTGMPLAPTFDALPSRAEARRMLGLPADGPVVLVSQGTVGSGPWTIPLVLGLQRGLPSGTHLLVLTGRNRATARVLDTLPLPPRIHRMDFVSNFHVCLRATDVMIGKAGGMSVTAAFVAETPLVIFAPNALESESARRFVAAGVALNAAGSVTGTTALVNRLLASPHEQRALAEAAARFVVHGGRQRLAALALRALTAERVLAQGSRVLHATP